MNVQTNLADVIIHAAAEVHQLLGPGLLESIYESALAHELTLLGIPNERQRPIPVMYKGASVRDPLYLDLIVDNRIIVEVKATERDYPLYQIQLYTYLKLTGIQSGLLINFGKQNIKDSVCRLVNQL